MSEQAPVVDKSLEDTSAQAPATNVAKENTKPAKKSAGKKSTKTTPKVDKSFADDKKSVNKDIKVGDTVSYPYPESEHGKRTSKVYDVTDSVVTILGHDGQKKTVALDRVELV